MKRIIAITILLSIVVFYGDKMVFAEPLNAKGSASGFVVIVNIHGPLLDADLTMVKSIYLGDKKFIDGVKVKPVNFSEGALKEGFLKSILSMTSKEYKLYWVKKVFQESAKLPRSIATTYGAVKFVKENEGGIAYIPSYSAKLLGREVVVIRL